MVPQSMETEVERGMGKRLITNYVVALGTLLTGNVVVRVCVRESVAPTWAVWGLAIASSIPMLLFAVYFFRMLRGELDEMVQRVVFEGMAFAMVVFIPLAGFYVNGCAAGAFRQPLDTPDLLLIPSLLVGLGILMAWSRLK